MTAKEHSEDLAKRREEAISNLENNKTLMSFKNAPIGARFIMPNSKNKDIWVKINSFPKGMLSDGFGLVVQWNGNIKGYQSHCCWVDDEHDFDTIIELI